MSKTLDCSVDKLIFDCYEAALEIAYIDDNCCKTRTKPSGMSDSLFDEVWSWVDGLYQKNFFNSLDGRCSIKTFTEFSIENEEKYMREFLVKLKPHVLAISNQDYIDIGC